MAGIGPKKKHSHARKMKRRSNVWKLDMPGLSNCTQCGELKSPHRVCGNCGYYNGKQVVKMEA
jgi:large subunit ribosomal protein L32